MVPTGLMGSGVDNWPGPGGQAEGVPGVLGLAIAGSTATGPGQTASLWLMAHLPIVGAYREPRTWSALWLPALVVGGAEAVTRLRRRSGFGGVRGPALGNLAAAAMVLATLFPAGVAAIRKLPATVTPSGTPRAGPVPPPSSPRTSPGTLPWSSSPGDCTSRSASPTTSSPPPRPGGVPRGRLLSPTTGRSRRR